MVALISPSPPGGISSAEMTVAVQPHDPVAFFITSIPSPLFCILNTCSTFVPSSTCPYLKLAESAAMTGVPFAGTFSPFFEVLQAPKISVIAAIRSTAPFIVFFTGVSPFGM
jgi:hypothetical protein